MRRLGYQALGYVVWKGGASGAKLYLRQRYGDTARKLAVGALVVGVLAALLLAQRRAGNGD